MSRTSGMIIGYCALFTGWLYGNLFLIIAGTVVLALEMTSNWGGDES